MLAAVAAGAAGGLLVRGVLVDLAFALGGTRPPRDGCGMEEVLECTAAALPGTVAALVEVAVVLFGLMALSAGAGLALLVVGLVRAGGPVPPDRPAVVLAFTGSVLVAAPAWLLASLAL